ncbi:hypothetical protein GGD63_007271 [Bradyrhizobium sp. cir1]|nr:hypothetical protein [Bradyrhizobium sp. cir1]MBB4374441.1 hypothetical protein [Bradyrhizobium sp. cir1]
MNYSKEGGVVGWAKRSVPTNLFGVWKMVGTAHRAFAHPCFSALD